jgi:hypothetical protein
MDGNNQQPTQDSIDEFLASFGNTNPTPADTTPTEPEPTPPVTDPAPTEPDPTPATEPTVPTEPAATQPIVEDKSSKAFAAMRVENANYKHMLTNMAQTLGIKETNPDQVMQVMQTKLNEITAKQQGVPPELFNRLQQLEQAEGERRVINGFQQVKEKFSLSDADLQTFADSLAADGINPFNQPIDLVSAYQIRNFDTLIEAAKQRGIQEELERATKASSQSSVPNQAIGNPAEPEPGQVNTFAQLDALFNSKLKS